MKLSRTLLLLTILAAGCGSGSDNGGPPNNPSPPNSPPVATTTVTITAAGVNPKNIVVPLGSRVTFINNDVREHEMASDPHPEHGDCLPVNDVGFLAPGQNKQTGNLTTARTCGFHDHNRAEVTALQGSILVQ